MAKKICIVLSSLSDGGTERFGATLSCMLSELGHNVYLFTTHNATEYEFCGQLFSLEEESNKAYGVLGKLKTMHQFFKSQNFDVIIDNRLRSRFFKEFLVYNIFYKGARIIAMIHNYKVSNYFPVNRFVSKRLYYDENIEFIGVSKQIKERTLREYGFLSVKHLYNPINLKNLQNKADAFTVELPYRYILYFGRFEEVAKNLTLLVNSYSKSQLKNKSIKLLLMGKGDDKVHLINLVNTLQLDGSIIFMDYNPNPFPYVKEALFTVLSSKYEGFPMSIIESLAIGTPVVSVNCESGPREVINHKDNGLLVKNNDIEALSSAFNIFTEDEQLYLKCKENSKLSVQHLDVKVITQHWKTLLENEE